MIDIIIGLTDGGVFPIRVPDGFRVVVRDYDVPDDYDDAHVDADGERYQEIVLDG